MMDTIIYNGKEIPCIDSQMGEAAGAAAAISCKKNICLRNVGIKDIKSITEYQMKQ